MNKLFFNVSPLVMIPIMFIGPLILILLANMIYSSLYTGVVVSLMVRLYFFTCSIYQYRQVPDKNLISRWFRFHPATILIFLFTSDIVVYLLAYFFEKKGLLSGDPFDALAFMWLPAIVIIYTLFYYQHLYRVARKI